MTLLRPTATLFAVAVFAALARSACADDAQTAAAVPAKQKDVGGFARQLTAPKIQKTTSGAKKRAKARKGAGVKTDASKYKSRELTENGTHAYRFNENGEPLNSAPKKKTASDDADVKKEKAGACSTEEPCPARSPDADAF